MDSRVDVSWGCGAKKRVTGEQTPLRELSDLLRGRQSAQSRACEIFLGLNRLAQMK